MNPDPDRYYDISAPLVRYTANEYFDERITLGEIGRALHVHSSKPSGWRNGKLRIRGSVIPALAEVIGVDVASFMHGARPRPEPERGYDLSAQLQMRLHPPTRSKASDYFGPPGLARALNLDLSVIQLWRSGKRPVPRCHVQAIADAFGISVDELLSSTPPAPVEEIEIAPPHKPSRLERWLAEHAAADAQREAEAERFRQTMGRPRWRLDYVS